MDHLWLPCFKSNRLSMTCRSTRDAYLSIPHTPLYDFIKNDFIQEGDGQVASGSASLPDPVSLETEEQRLEREQNEHDVLEALGDYKCDAEMSVENVPAVVNIKTLKGRFIAHEVSTGWAVGW